MNNFSFVWMINDSPNFRQTASFVSHLNSASFFSMSFTAVGKTQRNMSIITAQEKKMSKLSDFPPLLSGPSQIMLEHMTIRCCPCQFECFKLSKIKIK